MHHENVGVGDGQHSEHDDGWCQHQEPSLDRADRDQKARDGHHHQHEVVGDADSQVALAVSQQSLPGGALDERGGQDAAETADDQLDPERSRGLRGHKLKCGDHQDSDEGDYRLQRHAAVAAVTGDDVPVHRQRHEDEASE